MDEYREYVDAIVLAQQTVQKFLNSLNSSIVPMPVPVLSVLPLHGDQVAAPEGLPRYIAEDKGFTLQLARIDGMQTLLAYFLRWRDPERVRIVYSSELNRCWSRFLICKEIAHLILGTESNYTSTSQGATDLLTTLVSDGLITGDSPELRVESVAYYAAVELLLPFQHQNSLREFVELGRDNKSIAKSFLVPEAVIELRCNNHIAKSIFDAAYEKVSQ